MKKINLLILMVGWVIAIAAQNPQSVPDPWVGTWKLDLSQSQFHNPAPQQQTVQVQAAAQGTIQYTLSGTDAQGKPMLESFEGKADGQAYPISINGLEGGKIAYQKVSDREFTGQGTMLDGTTVTNNVTLSPDGQTMTIKSRGTSSKGAFEDTLVYVKQQQP
jgi:hypothetical protein